MIDVSEQIKNERKKRGLTIKSLSKLAGCSPNYLSLIENKKAKPSAEVLGKISEALDLKWDRIFANKNQEEIFIKKDRRTRIVYPDNKVIKDLLISDLSNKIMEPAYKIIPVNADSNGWHRHKGEEFGYILRGTLELRVASETCILEEGDSFYFDSTAKHYYKNVGDIDVETIWVVSPPSTFKYLFLKKH
ncbi:helix-turn-helix domain-containing protein [Desulfurella sp.]|uniref:helix-turn-helix domain-containing protein n=1 Tax=Desulfurella sp. TaxID=1962857 RepID=UPI003D130DA2